MTTIPVSKSQVKASRNWDAQNRNRANYIRNRSTVKSFINDNKRNNIQQPEFLDDLYNFKELITKKINEIESK